MAPFLSRRQRAKRRQQDKRFAMGLNERATASAMTAGSGVGAAHRFRHGFSLLLLAFQALRRDSLAWRRYVRTCALQAVVTVAIASFFVSTARTSSEGLREVRVRKAMENVTAIDAPPPPVPVPAPAPHPHASKRTRAPTPPPPPPPPVQGARGVHGTRPSPSPAAAPAAPVAPAEANDEDDDAAGDAEDKADAAQEKFERTLQKLQASITKLSKKAGPTAVRRDQDFQDSRMALDEELADLEQSAKKVPVTEEDKATLVRLGGELDVLEQKTKPGFWDSAWALVLSIYGALSLAQGAVIALSRDYHAAIARDASLLLGVAPEDPPLTPRVRLNVAWVRRKLKQRTRTLFVFLPGVLLISLAALPFPERGLITSILTSFWAAYWWVVWTASKSARAWERNGVARSPWFLRLWHKYVVPLPLLGWLAKTWEKLWTRFSRSAFSPAEAAEGQPVEFAGLAAARALQLIPLLKLFIRPLVPVAAARLIAERSLKTDRLLPTPQERATLTAERAAMPLSKGALDARDEM
jgi:hypothetical protein